METLNKICQSCGMPVAVIQHFGTNADQSINEEYCCFCYQNGKFTHDMDIQATIENSISYMDGTEKEAGRTLTKNEATLKMQLQLPTLKRWRSHNTTHQFYYKAVNKTIDYINDHLTDIIHLSHLAQIAHISEFHFHRIFKSIMGESPGDYIQRLRLEKAAFKLQTTKLNITDIVEQSGYQSHQAFTKAFKKHFGTSPSDYRKQPFDLKAPEFETNFYPLDEPEIKEIIDKQVISTRVINPFIHTDAYLKAWKKLFRFMKVNGIPGKETEYITMSHDTSTITHPEKCRIYACITCGNDTKPNGQFSIQTIKGGLYAIFTYKGSYKSLEAVYCSIYRNWILNSEYELRDLAFFEKYLNNPDHTPKEELITEIYIPVKLIKKVEKIN